MTGPSLVGKRVCLPNGTATVAKADDGLCWVTFDRWVTPGVVLQSVIASLPVLQSRASFDYAAEEAAYHLNQRRAA